MTETCLNDYHKLIKFFFKSHSVHHKSNTICYRKYRALDESKYLHDVKNLRIFPVYCMTK